MFAADPANAIANALGTLEQAGITKLTTEDAKKIISAKDPLARASEMVAKSGEVVVIGEANQETDYWGDCLWIGIIWTLTLIGKTLAILFSALIAPTSIRILYEKAYGGCGECAKNGKSCAWHGYCIALFSVSVLLLISFLLPAASYGFRENFALKPQTENLINLMGGKPTIRMIIFLIILVNLFSGLTEIGHYLKKQKANAPDQPAPAPASHS